MQSLQSSPEALQGQDYSPHLANPAPLELPESAVTATKSTNKASASKESTAPPLTSPNRSGSLMRKLSQSAKAGVQQRLRRKTSASEQGRREHSSGPITRRRSDSRTATSNGTSTADLMSGDLDDGHLADSPYASGVNDTSSITSEPFSPIKPTAPTLPDQLIRGSLLTKVTKRKRKHLEFFLAVNGSTVSWNPAKASKAFYVDDIKSIRYGDDALNYRQDYGTEEHEADCWFTILYADPDRPRQTKAIHLIAQSREDMFLWIDTLDALSKHREDLMTGMTGTGEHENVIRAHWDREIRKHRSPSLENANTEAGTLDLRAVEGLCRGLHIHCPKSIIQEQFRLADSRDSGSLNYNEFKDFVRRLKERKDFRPIFKHWAQGDEHSLTKKQFFLFLEVVQGIDVTSDVRRWEYEFWKWSNLSEATRPKSSDGSSSSVTIMDFEAFASFLVSEACNVYSGAPSQARFDKPLNEYFISTSHNTYLTGRQFAGDSSTEAYITALRHGCRCVEIDCWNGPDGRPIVTHGHTRTSSVLFVDCINSIGRYAFESSEYPVILSLEVHCDAEQQAKMVDIMKDGLGEKLILHPLSEQPSQLPSPESLKNKILVKVKTSENTENGILSDQGRGRRFRSISSPSPRPELPETLLLPDIPPLCSPPTMSPSTQSASMTNNPYQRAMTATSVSSTGEESDTAQVRKSVLDVPQKVKNTSKITKVLADLGVYLQGYKYRGFVTMEAREYNHIFSLDETKAGSLCKNPQEKAQFEDHNLRYMFRVYPKGLRLDSSNFDPNIFWRRGVQMVALNWQTYDRFQQINQAMFAAGTDRHGYVLKPDYLRQPRVLNGAVDSRLKLPRRLVRFSVEVISAQQLPRLHGMERSVSINPFIQIQVYNAEDKARGIATGSGGEDSSARNGFSGVGIPYVRRTKVVPDNGYNPQFNEKFEFAVETKYPELVFVRWIVYSSPNSKHTVNGSTQVAVFTAKLSSMQQGYRHLPLYNGHGEEYIFSTLFCKIKKEEPILIPSSVDEVNRRATGRSAFRNMLSRNPSSDRGGGGAPQTEEQRKRLMKEIRERGPRI
jgi:phosphatidylinositol phospholipase C, delta